MGKQEWKFSKERLKIQEAETTQPQFKKDQVNKNNKRISEKMNKWESEGLKDQLY